MANYLFQNYPEDLGGGEGVYAILINPVTLEMYDNVSVFDWVTYTGLAGGVYAGDLKRGAVPGVQMYNLKMYYIEVPVTIAGDNILAKWYVGQVAGRNLGPGTIGGVPENVNIGTSSYSPASALLSINSDDINAIAEEVLTRSVVESGVLNQYSLGAMTLSNLSADTTTVVNKLVTRNPGTGSVIHQYDIDTGHGQPIRGIG